MNCTLDELSVILLCVGSDVVSSQTGSTSAVAKESTAQIQKLVLSHLNSVVAMQLLALVDGLRSSCIGSVHYIITAVVRVTLYCVPA